MPTKNPRVVQAAHAYVDINLAVVNAVEKYNLTWGEIAHILADIARSWAGYQIADEREDDEFSHVATPPTKEN